MYQKIFIVGNLGKDPEMAYTPDGKARTTFSVATSERKDKTAWFRVTAWERTAEIVNQYAKKGQRVLVEGRLEFDAETGGPRVYQKKDGSWAASFEVSASVVKLLGKSEVDDEPVY